MELIKHSPNIFDLRTDKYQYELLIISDVHFDAIGCDRKLLKQHLDEAVQDGCMILIIGDWFDLMQGRYDPRRSNQHQGMRQEYIDSDKEYLDAILEDSINFLKPYVDNILFFALGNHETSVMKNCGTNPIQTLVTMLNHYVPDQKIPLVHTGYTGWLKISSEIKGTHIRSCLIKFRHGDRGNAKRSKGILDVDIDAMRWPDADIIVKGDDHMKWLYPAVVRKKLNKAMQLVESCQYQIRLGCYVDGLLDEYGGWAVEKGFTPNKRGGWRVKINHRGHQQNDMQVRIYEA